MDGVEHSLHTGPGLTEKECDKSDSRKLQAHKGARRDSGSVPVLNRSKSLSNVYEMNNQEGEILFHPDFVDWRTCEQHSTNNSADEPQLLGIVVKDAHRSISRLLQWSG